MQKRVKKSEFKILGRDSEVAIDSVAPNDWNPNVMTPFTRDSLKQDLVNGWIGSEKILVWGTDEKGVQKNIIIDGEHRWRIAKEIGFEIVPTTTLDGITRAEAIKLTIKIDQKRGNFEEVELGSLLKEIRGDLDLEIFSVDMGFEVPKMEELLGEKVADVMEGMSPSPLKGVPKVVLEFSTEKRRDAFKRFLAKIEGDEKPSGDLLCGKLRIR